MIVEVSANSPTVGDGFNYHFAYFMACTLEDDVGCGMRHWSLRLASLLEARRELIEECLQEGKKHLGQGKKVYKVCLKQGRRKGCLEPGRATTVHKRTLK